MSTSIALLRGINVGGHNKVAMSDLRDLCADLGFAHVKSLLQSGNLIFEGDQQGGAELESFLEKETAKRLGLSAGYIIRSANEWRRIIARNPFPAHAQEDRSHLVVVFLKSVPSARSVEDLRAAIKGPEILHSDKKNIYIVYPAGIGRSKLTGTLIEAKLGVAGTARNWNTILKLAELCP